jgi:NADPH:quinone reductase-like Zn-dependent oxidoreductase
LKGKKVAFLGNGWSQYSVKDAKYSVVLDDELDLAQAANAYVNPYTALAMLDFSKNHNAKTVISTAASSALGK